MPQPLPRRRHGRYQVVFEPPESDAEFISTTLGIAHLLAALADLVEDYRNDLIRRRMPAPIVAQWTTAAEELHEAAYNARNAATTFADIFEESRDIAAAGIRILGGRNAA
ncbi:hypothetical protein GCM10009678_04870 [Actinomadura kijaniata]|uniref:Uncharacterized protein n=1 Tax=Actinomadura namibiensis TaxID=182080 RepID=A0A7W3LTE8_ACTNM|nr:hypothetical protein [Actinomadura namibiensis]MBA8953949.1 hypothetical protein [Actinomadura namibiensis]